MYLSVVNGVSLLCQIFRVCQLHQQLSHVIDVYGR